MRYADDFLVLCLSAEAAGAALKTTTDWMQANQLRLHLEKTRIASFSSGFQFLGVFFLGVQVYIPWKGGRPQGRLLSMARPMPAHMLATYTGPPPRTQMEQAFQQAGQPWIPTAPREGDKLVAHLYITDQGSILRKSGKRFLVEKGDRILLDLPYHKLENVSI